MCNYFFPLMEKNTNQAWDHQTITWVSRAHPQRLQWCHTKGKQMDFSLFNSIERKQFLTCAREIPEPLSHASNRKNTHGNNKHKFTIKKVNCKLCRNCFFTRKYTEIQCQGPAAACNPADTTYTATLPSASSIDGTKTFLLWCSFAAVLKLFHALKIWFHLPQKKQN